MISLSESLLVPLNLLICLSTALVLVPLQSSLKMTRAISLLGSLLFLCGCVLVFGRVLNSGPIHMQAGSWIPPYGISFSIDTFGAMMLLISGVIGFCGNIAAQATLDEEVERRYFHVFYHFLLLGCVGAFSTGDLFNLYVWFEVLLISSFVLSALSKKEKVLAGAVKYVALSLLSSFFFLMGLGLVYNAGGSLQMNDLAAIFNTQGKLMPIASLCLFLAFSIKAGTFPLFQWLPANYPGLPSSILAVFAGLLTKVGMFALIRVFSAQLLRSFEGYSTIVFGLAIGTMIVGVWAAISQNNIKKILSAHIISQIGYMLLGFALNTPLGVAAAIFYLFHHIIVKSNLFFVCAWIEKLYDNCDLKKLHSLRDRHWFLALSFAIPALSLVGVPPLSGFWAKFFTLRASLDSGQMLAFFAALFVSALTLYSMAKIWMDGFWSPAEEMPTRPLAKLKGRARWVVLPVIFLNAWTIVIGIQFQSVWQIAQRAATELLGGSR